MRTRRLYRVNAVGTGIVSANVSRLSGRLTTQQDLTPQRMTGDTSR